MSARKRMLKNLESSFSFTSETGSSISSTPRSSTPFSPRSFGLRQTFQRNIVTSSQRRNLKPLKELSNTCPEPELIEFELSGLKPWFSPRDLRAMCSNIHIVSATSDNDALNGQCKGTGRVMIRVSPNATHDLDKFKMALASRGICIRQPEDKNTMKLRITSRDHSKKAQDPSTLSFVQWTSIRPRY